MPENIAYTQQQILFSEQLKEAGIKKAVDHADAAPPFNWSEKAFDFLLNYLKDQPPGVSFKTEDIILKAEQLNAIPKPPDDRAFGAIILKARREGLIKSIGISPRKKPAGHMGFTADWIKQ